jgi:shikimate dehydrogenase
MLSLGLIGYPLIQSLSPQLHHAALHSMGLEGQYRLFPIPGLPEGEPLLIEQIARLHKGDLDGLNVTIPHKQSVIQYLDRLSEQAEAIGAVNTITRREGHVVGENTDASGFILDLYRVLRSEPGTAHLTQKRDGRLALVLGAGGAARAVVYALQREGWDVVVASRRMDQAVELIATVGQRLPAAAAGLSAVALERGILQDLKPQVIVNASSAGMIPDIDTSPWPTNLALPLGAFVYDLIYKPLETKLIRSARQAGHKAANGLGMLVEQAALALEMWSGTEVPRQAMWESIGYFSTNSSMGPEYNSAREGS